MAFQTLLTLKEHQIPSHSSFPGHVLKCYQKDKILDLPTIVFSGSGALVEMLVQNVNIGDYQERDEFLNSITMLEVQCDFSEKTGMRHAYSAIEQLKHLLPLVSTLVVRIIGSYSSVFVFYIPPLLLPQKMDMIQAVFSCQNVKELESKALKFLIDEAPNAVNFPTLRELVIEISFREYYKNRKMYLSYNDLITVYAVVDFVISSMKIDKGCADNFEEFCKSVSTVKCCDLVGFFDDISSRYVKNLFWDILDWEKDANISSINQLGFENLVSLTIFFPLKDFKRRSNVLNIDLLKNLKRLELHNAPSSVDIRTYSPEGFFRSLPPILLDYFCVVNFRGEKTGFISATHVVVRHSVLNVFSLGLLNKCSILELSTSEVVDLIEWEKELANITTLKIEGTVVAARSLPDERSANFSLPRLVNLEIKSIPRPADDRYFLKFQEQELRLDARMVPNLESVRIVAHRVVLEGSFSRVSFWSFEYCKLVSPDRFNRFIPVRFSARELRTLNLVCVKGLQRLQINEGFAPKLTSLIIRQASNYYNQNRFSDLVYRLPKFSQRHNDSQSCLCCCSGVSFSPFFPQLQKLVLRCSNLSNETPWDPVIAFSMPKLVELNISKPLSIPNFYDIQFRNCTRMILGHDDDRNATPPTAEQIAKIRSSNKQSYMYVMVIGDNPRNVQMN